MLTGRGKTFILNTVISYVRGKGQIALCCASSAFAAALYPGGRTAHNLFKIDVLTERGIGQKVQCNVSPTSERAHLLQMASVAIWDEFVMSNKENFEAVDEMLKTLRQRPDFPCGGFLFIGAGDFRQIPPIEENGTRSDTVAGSIKYSKLWSVFSNTL